MTLSSPVAVTGTTGRLGRALLNELDRRGIPGVAWSRPDYDLDEPDAAKHLIARDRPATVIHSAAWTDVDGCARELDLARRRNATAVGELARLCAYSGTQMLLVSTNEVFDGARKDGRGYAEGDEVAPINAYGASKLAGEAAAREAVAGGTARLWVARSVWLFGPPGIDFPTKIIAAAGRLEEGTALRVVDDEIGSPTFTPDLAKAILDLIDRAPPGTYHLAAAGHGSRFEVAKRVLDKCRPGTPLEPISQREFQRPSSPPPWAVLDTSRAATHGVQMRDWREAMSDYLGDAC